MIATLPPTMNEASERDPFNNNSYGTTVDRDYRLISLPVLDVIDFNDRVIRGYEEGWGERDLPADLRTADVVQIAAIALVLALLSTLYPAWRGARRRRP